MVALLGATAVFGTRPMISYRALALDASTFEIGLIASAFGLFAFAGAIPIGRLADRFGGRPVVTVGTSVIAVTTLVLVLADSVLFLVLGQATLGIGQLMLAIGSQTTVAALGGADDKGRMIGTYSVATSLGHALGPMVAGMIAGRAAGALDINPVFVVFSVVAVVAAALSTRFPLDRDRTEDGSEDADTRPGVVETLTRRGMRQAITSSVVILCALDLLIAYLPVYGEERAIGPQTIGLAIGMLAFSQIPSRLFLSHLISRFGNVPVLVGSMVIPALVLPLLVLPLGGVALIGITCLVGLNLGLGQPMTLVLIAAVSAPNGRGLAMSLRFVGSRFGQLTIPAAVAATAGRAGVAGIMVAVALMLGAGSVSAGVGGEIEPVPTGRGSPPG